MEGIVKSHFEAQNVVKESDMVELEGIDMSLPESEIIPKMMNNLQNVGFFAMVNVPDFDEGELFRAVKAFYTDVSPEERRGLVWHNHCPENANYYRGLTPFVDNDAAHKEMYDMGGSLRLVSDESLKYALYEETPFPPQEQHRWIRQAFEL